MKTRPLDPEVQAILDEDAADEAQSLLQKYGDQALCRAISNYDVEAAIHLIETRPDLIDKKEEEVYHRFPITVAVSNGHDEIVKHLIKHKANLSYSDPDPLLKTALRFQRMAHNNTKILKMLMESKTEWKKEDAFIDFAIQILSPMETVRFLFNYNLSPLQPLTMYSYLLKEDQSNPKVYDLFKVFYEQQMHGKDNTKLEAKYGLQPYWDMYNSVIVSFKIDDTLLLEVLPFPKVLVGLVKGYDCPFDRMRFFNKNKKITTSEDIEEMSNSMKKSELI